MRLLLSRMTLNNMFQFFALLDAQGTMWDMNHTALRGAGITRTDIHRKPFWEARWWQTSVETREQLDFLTEHGCHEFQGYYFRRPQPAEDFSKLLRDNAGTLALAAAG